MKCFGCKAKNIYIYVLIFSCIYIEFGYTAVVANYLSGTVRSILLILISIPSFYYFKSKQSNKSLLFLLYIFIILFLSQLRDSSIGDYMLLILPIGVGYIIATRIPFILAIKSFCNIVYWLAYYSIICYLICALFPFVANLLPTIGYFQDSHCTMHNAVFSVVINGANFPRNFGIAWEPGAFSILLCLAIFAKIFFYSNINKKRIIIYSIAVITTFSTMGYAVLTAIFLSFFTIKNASNRGIIILACILVIITLQIPFMQELTFGKLEGLTNSSEDINATTSARLDAVLYPGAAFIDSPILGIGYDKFKYINTVLCNNVATNTIVNWFALFGLLLGFPLLYFYLYTIVRILKNKISVLNIIIILASAVLMISTESLLRISLIYYIIFLGTINYKHINISIRG